MSLKNLDARKAYQKEYYRKWYANPKNAKNKKLNAKKHRGLSLKRNKDYVLQYKLTHPCCKCAHYHPEYIEKHPVCLQFHHCNGIKEIEVSTMMNNMVCLEKLQIEIDKCIVVCGNCHARMHEEMRAINSAV